MEAGDDGNDADAFSEAHADKYLSGYGKDGGRKHETLEAAQEACASDPTAGGITQEAGGYTVRAGGELRDSPSGETSWLKKKKERSPPRKPLAKPERRANAMPAAPSEEQKADEDASEEQKAGEDASSGIDLVEAPSEQADLTGEAPEPPSALKRSHSSVQRTGFFEELQASVKKTVGDRHEIDTGPTRDEASHFLSWTFMEEKKRAGRPGIKNESGEWTPMPICMDVGQHVPCTKHRKTADEPIRHICFKSWKDTNALAEYGLGVSLYFKYLKFMIGAFLIVCIINIPGMMLWYLGSNEATGVAPSQTMKSNFGIGTQSPDPWGFFGFYTGMGSWGEGTTQCYTGIKEGDEVNIQCGEKGGSITSVVAFYGEPKGICGCPVENRVETDTGLCPDGMDGPKQMTYGGNDLLVENSMCCYEKSLREDELNIYNDPACFSSTAKYIAAGKCKNRHSCYFKVDYEAYDWGNNYACDPSTESFKETGTRCATRWLDDSAKLSNFSGCTANCKYSEAGYWTCDNYDNMELNIVATCEKKRIWGIARDTASAVCSSFDALSMLVLWCMLIWLELKQKSADKAQNLDVCSPGDYTVLIAGLPKAKDDEELKTDLVAHFQKVIEAEKPTGKKDKQVGVSNSVVMDVNFAHSNATLIHNKILRGHLARVIDDLKAKFGLYMLFTFERKQEKGAKSHKEYAEACFEKGKKKAYKKRIKFVTRLIGNRSVKIEKQEAEEHLKRPKYAYVTFDSEEAYLRCRNAYPNLGKIANFFQASRKRLFKNNPNGRMRLRKKIDGKWEEEDREAYPDFIAKSLPDCCKCIFGEGFRLRILEATEPEDVIWEHLGYSDFSRGCRKLVAAGVMIAFISISFAVVLYGNVETAQQDAKFPACANTEYLHYCFGDQVDSHGVSTYDGQTHFDGNEVCYGYKDGDSSKLTVQDVIKDSNYEDWDDVAVVGESGLKACMCDYMATNLASNPYTSIKKMMGYIFYPDLNPGVEGATPEKYCNSYYKSYLIKTSITSIIVCVVIGVNVLIEYVAKFCAQIERHATYSAELTSIVHKQFIATFLNTAVLILVINGSLRRLLPTDWQEFLESLTSEQVEDRPLVFGGTYQDIDAKWFSTIGVALFATLFSQSVVAPLSNTSEYVLTKLLRWKDRGFHFATKQKLVDPDTRKAFDPPRYGHISRQVTQAGLNHMYAGGEFKLTKRYAQQLALVFSLVLYSAALPGLYVFGFFAFVLYYVVDKYLFTRYYRTPEKFDASLAIMAVNALPYAIWLHLSLSLWMYSNPHIFHAADDDYGVVDDAATSTEIGGYSATATSFAQDYQQTSFGGHDLFRDTKQTQRTMLTFLVWIISSWHLFYRDFLIPCYDEISHILVPLVLAIGAMFPCCHLEKCIDEGAEPENNPPFLHAIPTEQMAFRINEELLAPEIVEQYKAELDRRESDEKAGVKAEHNERLINGLESYNMEANPKYTELFAEDSVFLTSMRKSGRRLSELRDKSKDGKSKFNCCKKSTSEQEKGTYDAPSNQSGVEMTEA